MGKLERIPQLDMVLLHNNVYVPADDYTDPAPATVFSRCNNSIK